MKAHGMSISAASGPAAVALTAGAPFKPGYTTGLRPELFAQGVLTMLGQERRSNHDATGHLDDAKAMPSPLEPDKLTGSQSVPYMTSAIADSDYLPKGWTDAPDEAQNWVRFSAI
jgi:hypothetical protein